MEISTRVKGPPSVTIKVYAEDPQDAADEALSLYAYVVENASKFGNPE